MERSPLQGRLLADDPGSSRDTRIVQPRFALTEVKLIARHTDKRQFVALFGGATLAHTSSLIDSGIALKAWRDPIRPSARGV